MDFVSDYNTDLFEKSVAYSEMSFLLYEAPSIPRGIRRCLMRHRCYVSTQQMG